MRICLFTPTFLPLIGGAERDADILVRGLIERGHDVQVLARRLRGRPVPQLPYRVHHYRRPPAQHLLTSLLSRPLARLHRRWPFEVVLAFYSYPTGYAASRIKDRLRVGVVASPRGADLYPNYHDLRKPRVPGLIAAGYRNADRIVSISHWITQRLHEVVGDDLPPIDLVYNGIDFRQFDAEIAASRSAAPALPVRKPFILHLARVAPVKRQDLAVEAVCRMRGEFERRGLQYVIVGDGPAMPDIRQRVERNGLQDIVVMLGMRTGVEKAWLLDNAQFMVSTSREEGLGNVVLEAMAAGLPMLGSDIGPHRELIGDLGWGLLFRSGDVDDLAAQMKRMVDADVAAWRRRAMAQRSRFSLSAMIDGYEAACRAAAIDSRCRAAAAERP
jgi:L-malate glycosyltransferase